LIEMTDAELQAWHAKLRDHRNFQTMQAHIASVAPLKEKKTSSTKKQQDISEFV